MGFLLANAAHELKTPVTVLLGEAQVLSRQPRSLEEHERFEASVQDEMRRFAQLIDGLLTLARAHAGFPIPLAQPVSLNEAVTDAVQSCQPLARHCGVRLILRLAPPRADAPDLAILGDGELLSLMVANLIRNAIRHTPVTRGTAARTGNARTRARSSSVVKPFRLMNYCRYSLNGS